MKVAIMGAAGWVGRAVLENFAGRHQVRAFDYSPEAWSRHTTASTGIGREKNSTGTSLTSTPFTKLWKEWTAASI